MASLLPCSLPVKWFLPSWPLSPIYTHIRGTGLFWGISRSSVVQWGRSILGARALLEITEPPLLLTALHYLRFLTLEKMLLFFPTSTVLLKGIIFPHGPFPLPWWLGGKESTCQCREDGFNPCVGKIPWRRKGSPLQYSCLGDPMDRGAWWVTIHGVAKERHNLVTQQQQNSVLGNSTIPCVKEKTEWEFVFLWKGCTCINGKCLKRSEP